MSILEELEFRLHRKKKKKKKKVIQAHEEEKTDLVSDDIWNQWVERKEDISISFSSD